MKKRKLSRGFGFEKLEGRRLLAADFCMQAIPEVETIEPVHCEMATFDCPAGDAVADTVTESAPVAETDAAQELDPRNLDLTDGMDGYFGAINAENPVETLQFTATGDGSVDVVLASSFGVGHASLSVTNSQGEVVETQGQGLEGFDVLTFEVAEGETYQLSVSSDNPNCEGQFQVTAGFSAFADQHVDEVGSDSTQLELVENQADLSGRLESAGDIDTFRFTATANGEMTLELHETVDDARIGLGVSIEDAAGNILAQGATNEMLQISFDVSEGQEYFISLAASEGQTGTYDFNLNLQPAPESASQIVDSGPVDESADPYVTPPTCTDQGTSEAEMVDNQATENQDANTATSDPSNAEVAPDVNAPEANPDSELVDTIDESSTTDATAATDATADTAVNDATAETAAAVEIVNPDLTPDCELVETGSDVGDTEITDALTEVEPTDAIAVDTEDQQTGDPVTESGLADVPEEQLDAVLPGDWTTCGQTESIIPDASVAGDLVASPELEPVTNDLNADSSTDVTQTDPEIYQPLASIDDQAAVDDFFAELGNDFELHFDLSFGHYNLETVFSLV